MTVGCKSRIGPGTNSNADTRPYHTPATAQQGATVSRGTEARPSRRCHGPHAHRNDDALRRGTDDKGNTTFGTDGLSPRRGSVLACSCSDGGVTRSVGRAHHKGVEGGGNSIRQGGSRSEGGGSDVNAQVLLAGKDLPRAVRNVETHWGVTPRGLRRGDGRRGETALHCRRRIPRGLLTPRQVTPHQRERCSGRDRAPRTLR